MTTYATISLDRATFEPKSWIPKQLRSKVLFRLALLWTGSAVAEAIPLTEKLRTEVRAKLKAYSAQHFEDSVYGSAIDHAAENAFNVTRAQKNNFYAWHSDNDDGGPLKFKVFYK